VEQAYAGDIDLGVIHTYRPLFHCHLRKLEDFDPSTSTQQAVPQEMEFEDEEQLATVTVVENFDAVDLKMLSSGYDAAKEENVQGTPSVAKRPPQPAHKPPKSVGRSTPAKSKFRRGSKATSKHDKIKQRGRREEKAKRKKGRR
jgi:ribosomal RNA-processing protein 17